MGLRQTIAEDGLFRAICTDRGSDYFHTPKAGGKIDKTRLTELGRSRPEIPRTQRGRALRLASPHI
jgi:hypothetical protein